MATLNDEPLFVIGMEIIFDSRLEEALDACSLFDASDADGLSTGMGFSDSEDSLTDDDGSASSDESSAASEDVKARREEDEMMARLLAGANLDSDDDESDSESDSDEESDAESLTSAASPLDQSQNTNIAVMLRAEGGTGMGQSRRTKGSRRSLTGSPARMNLKDLTMRGGLLSSKPGTVLTVQAAANPVS